MKHLIYSWIISFLSIIAIDVIWLNVMGPRFYKIYLAHVFDGDFYYIPALVFYMMYTFGISYLVILPGLRDQASAAQIMFGGFILGLITYGAYDLTNQATIKDWPVAVTIVDMLWGAILTSMVSLIGYKALSVIVSAQTITFLPHK